jgi:hypothetical protein
MDGAFSGFAQVRLRFGGCLFDRVEVGAVGREEEQRCADALDGGPARTAGALWLDKLSITTTSPRPSSGTSTRVTQVRNASAFIGPSSTQGATMPVRRRPATKVVVFQ